MATPESLNLWLADGDDDIKSKWTTSTGDLHFHDYGFDGYNTEVIILEAEYDHRSDVKTLDWEETHRQWTSDAWQVDFAALDTAVKHFLDRGYTVTIAGSEVSIFLSDYDGPFIEAHLPDEPPPDVELDTYDDGQTDLDAF